MCTSISYAVSPNAIVAMWLFDEGAGETVGDSSGNGHDGKFVEAPVWGEKGKFGGALQFHIDDYISVPHDDSLSLTTWSITAWAKLEKIVGWGFILTKQEPYNVRNYSLYMSRGLLRTDFHCEAGTRRVEGKTRIDDERWHHLAGTYDMEALRVYVDGDLDGELAATDKPNTNDGTITIGADMLGGCCALGVKDEIGLFNKALTEGEIENIMAVGLQEASLAVEASRKLSTAWGKIRENY